MNRRSKQRGFLYMVTGANGAGKTLNTLKWAKEMADKEGRPVAYNGRFDLVPDGPLANWKKIDFKDWQAEPDGTIFVIDEAHNDLPTRGTGTPPEHVRMLAEHRKRGFDFFLITQHPMNVDSFVRRLVGSPGYHRHLKRTFGADLVSVNEWAAVNPQCEKPGSGDSGQTKMVPFPKEVYGWYKSAMLHTGKRTIPRAVYIAAAALVLVPALGWFAISSVTGNVKAKAEGKSTVDKPTATMVHQGAQPGIQGVSSTQVGGGVPKTLAQYVAAYAPRVEGLPHTAPLYDEITKPQQAPFPAACIERKGKDDCACFTQQGTRLQTPLALCRSIVANGYFMEWAAPAAAPNPAQGSHAVGKSETVAAQAERDAAGSQLFVGFDTSRNGDGRIGSHSPGSLSTLTPTSATPSKDKLTSQGYRGGTP